LAQAAAVAPRERLVRVAQARALVAASRFAEAGAAAGDLIEADPEDPAALEVLASAWLGLARPTLASRAVARAQAALRDRPSLDEGGLLGCRLGLLEAGILLAAPDAAGARAKAAETAARCPGVAEPWAMVGFIELQAGHGVEAAAALEEALRREPADSGLLTDLGHALRLQGKTEEALAVFARASRAVPEAVLPRANLGLLLLAFAMKDKPDLARLAQAAEHLESACEGLRRAGSRDPALEVSAREARARLEIGHAMERLAAEEAAGSAEKAPQ
jgi:tetratricopeptide (TPR) repeat protein